MSPAVIRWGLVSSELQIKSVFVVTTRLDPGNVCKHESEADVMENSSCPRDH